MSSMPQRQNFFEGIQMEDLYIWRHVTMALCLQCDFLDKMPDDVGFKLMSPHQHNRGFVFLAIHGLEEDYINGAQPGATIYANLPWYMRYPYHWIFVDRSPFLHGSTFRSQVFNIVPQSHLNFLKQHHFGTPLPEHIKRQNLFQHPSNEPGHPIPEEITDCDFCTDRFEFGCAARHRYHRLDDDILIQQMVTVIARAAHSIFETQHHVVIALFTEERSLWRDPSDEAKARVQSLKKQREQLVSIGDSIHGGMMPLNGPHYLLGDIFSNKVDSRRVQSNADYEEHGRGLGVYKTAFKTIFPLEVTPFPPEDIQSIQINPSVTPLEVFNIFDQIEIRDDYRPYFPKDPPAHLTAIVKAANRKMYWSLLLDVDKIVEANGGRYDGGDRIPGVERSICRRHYAPDF